MSVKRKIDSDDFIKGLKSAFAPIKEAVEPVGKEIKEINDKFTNAVKKELKPVTDKFKTKVAPLIDKAKETYSNVKEYVKSEEGQKNIANKAVEFAKAYREKYKEYFSLEEQIKNVYPDARITFDVENDENALKNSLGNYKTINVKNEGNEFKVRYYPETGKIRTVVPEEDEGLLLETSNESKKNASYDLKSIYYGALKLKENQDSARVGLHSKKGKPYITQKKKLDSASEELNTYLNKYGFESFAELENKVKGDDSGRWFDAGAFEDGFDWKDIPDVLIGTSADVALGIEQGIGRLAEGVVDLGAYGISGTQKLFGNDKAAKKTKEFAQRDLVGELTDEFDEEISELSILGEKADNFTEGLGQMAGIILTGGAASAAAGGSAAAATAATTALTGASSMGNGITEAYLGSANDKEAFKYGVRKGAIDAGTNLLFGGLGKASNAIGIGKGIGGFDDMLAKAIGKKVAGGIKNPTVQRVAMNTIEGLIKSGGEGAEELLSGYLTAHAKKDTYLTEEDFSKILKNENIGEQFWNSFITSLIAQAPSNIKSTVKGQDIITGLTDNEQKIDEKAFVDGLWGREESQDNANEENVESSQLESVENFDKSGIIKETVDNDTGVSGEYTDEIVWSIFKHLPVRKCGKGYFGTRIKQSDSRIDNYELKINPNNESFYLLHPDGKPVQFENMENGIVQDCKLVKGNNSIYYVKEKIPILNKNILEQARRQLEAANFVGYKVQWLVSDQKAVNQIRQLFDENDLDIMVTYYPE